MITKKILQFSLLAILTPAIQYTSDTSNEKQKNSFFRVAKNSSNGTLAQHLSLPTAAQKTDIPLKTSALVPTPNQVPSTGITPSCNEPDAEYVLIATKADLLAPENMPGQPFQPAALGAQDKPQVAGLLGRYDMPIVGWTPSGYLEDILTNGTAVDAFTQNSSEGGFKNPKMRERTTEAFTANMQAFEVQAKKTFTNNDTFLKEEQAALITFLAARAQRTHAFLCKQRTDFFTAMTKVDTLIAMATTIPGAEGCLNPALIKEQHKAMIKIRDSFSTILQSRQMQSLDCLTTLEKSTLTVEQQQADEINAELRKVNEMLCNLHALHPQSTTLAKVTDLPPYQTITQLTLTKNK